MAKDGARSHDTQKTIEAMVGRRKVGVERGGLVAFIH